MQVPFLDLRGQHARIRGEIDAALESLIDDGAFINGPEGARFEAAFARFCERRFARGVSSGTAALAIALRALELPPGAEVITAAHGAVPTAEAIVLAGATPVLVDIDPEHWLIDPDRVEDAITPRTRALLPVHLYGMPARIDRLLEIARRHDLVVVEDCAQAAGARFDGRRVGSFGHIGCHSFFPSKNLGGFGDGGALATDDESVDRFAAMYRDHGRLEKFSHESIGANERLDTLQAAVLGVKLRYLDEWNALRRRVADWYAEDLAGVPEVRLQRRVAGAEPVWHLFVVRLSARDRVAEALREKGVGTGLHYPVAVHRQPAFARLGKGPGSFPEAEQAASEVLSLPMDPFLTREQIRHVTDALKRCCVRASAA
jgi:dTDP-4-amino-4,6-dideoxygalactose transaminase